MLDIYMLFFSEWPLYHGRPKDVSLPKIYKPVSAMPLRQKRSAMKKIITSDGLGWSIGREIKDHLLKGKGPHYYHYEDHAN